MNPRTALIVTTCVLILVSLPHAIEDFQYGALARFGITLQLGMVVLATMYLLQLASIVWLFADKPRGAVMLAVTGAVWCIGATVIHGHDLLFAGPEYRHGFMSRLLELLVIVFGAVVTVIGIRVAKQT